MYERTVNVCVFVYRINSSIKQRALAARKQSERKATTIVFLSKLRETKKYTYTYTSSICMYVYVCKHTWVCVWAYVLFSELHLLITIRRLI